MADKSAGLCGKFSEGLFTTRCQYRYRPLRLSDRGDIKSNKEASSDEGIGRYGRFATAGWDARNFITLFRLA
jgi:hypothetical protein